MGLFLQFICFIGLIIGLVYYTGERSHPEAMGNTVVASSKASVQVTKTHARSIKAKR
jgi:hypothetical protein